MTLWILQSVVSSLLLGPFIRKGIICQPKRIIWHGQRQNCCNKRTLAHTSTSFFTVLHACPVPLINLTECLWLYRNSFSMPCLLQIELWLETFLSSQLHNAHIKREKMKVKVQSLRIRMHKMSKQFVQLPMKLTKRQTNGY